MGMNGQCSSKMGNNGLNSAHNNNGLNFPAGQRMGKNGMEPLMGDPFLPILAHSCPFPGWETFLLAHSCPEWAGMGRNGYARQPISATHSEIPQLFFCPFLPILAPPPEFIVVGPMSCTSAAAGCIAHVSTH